MEKTQSAKIEDLLEIHDIAMDVTYDALRGNWQVQLYNARSGENDFGKYKSYYKGSDRNKVINKALDAMANFVFSEDYDLAC